ncbi:MAG TPA: ATP-dependent DNA helicase RecG [Kiritimatiellia bacterium]|nr:ATP-dependent DNA helicase RecG [Kiritimatiellia bacterium]
MTDSAQRDWTQPVRFVRGVGESRAAQLARMDIHTVRDLLLTLPRRYEDRRLLTPLRALKSGDWAAVQVEVVRSSWTRPRFGKGYLEAVVTDRTALARCRWFNAQYLQEQLAVGEKLIVFGKAAVRKGGLVFEHPEIERVREEEDDLLHAGRIVPVYPLTENLGQRSMRRICWAAIETYVPGVTDALPAMTRDRWNLPGLQDALRQAHFPVSEAEAIRARERLVFEEFLCMQLVLAARKHQTEHVLEGRALQPRGERRQQLIASLPFQLTAGQWAALAEIRTDMARPHPMHRLLQGDVGSGKTIVAACAAVDAIECGTQVAVMAPTELLARQHAATFSRHLKPLGIRIAILSSSLPPDEKVAVRAQLADGRVHLVVGTHALIQDRVVFKDLGLVVIDEQHKFGVEQRGQLYTKGIQPDVLVMTATPIPRTLAMTWYGDLDVTTIREMPAGRQPIVTRVIREEQLTAAYDFIRKQVARGRQAYLVYPLVSESEQLDLKAATQMIEQLDAGPLRGLRTGLVHGQLPVEQRDRAMEKFRSGALDVLVATSVIEVGVDVPNATVMLIENAERFGLAQLHQLRGRIGRGNHKSYCILQAHAHTREAWQRLKVLEKTTDGFRIAEEDFQIRGMGNLFGREQSGGAVLKVADPLRDTALLEKARQEAFRMIAADPRLRDPDHAALREEARSLYRAASPFVKVG